MHGHLNIKYSCSISVLSYRPHVFTDSTLSTKTARVKITYKNIKRIITNFQVTEKILESLTVLLLQDLKATCEEQQGSISMENTTEVSNFGHCHLYEISFIYRTRRFDNWLFPNLQEIGTFWTGICVDCSVDCRLGPNGLESTEIACIRWELCPSPSSLQTVACLL